MYRVLLTPLVLTSLSISVHASCPPTVLAPLPYVMEHVIWRGWHQAIIYTTNLEKGCQWSITRLVKCLSVNGVGSAINTMERPRLRTKLGIIIFTPKFKGNSTDSLTNLIKKLNDFEMNSAPFDWLVTARDENDFKSINEILNSSSIRFDQNIAVAFPHHKHRAEVRSLDVCDSNFIYNTNKLHEIENDRRNSYRNRHRYSYLSKKCKYGSSDPNCAKTEYERNYFKTTERFRNLTRLKTYKRGGSIYPLFQSGVLNYNYSKSFEMVNVSRFSLKQQIAKWSQLNRFYGYEQAVYLIQYFKVHVNSTLYAYLLGCWTKEHSMTFMETPYPTEARNFIGEALTVGRCNSSGNGVLMAEDDGPSAPASLDDVLDFLTVRLNTTSITRYYGKLGFRTYEGVWTGLLGALMDYSVDLALEPVTAHPPRHQDMDFIFPIAETMCNIYIRHKETSTVRDIFMAPFSPRLVMCVVAVVVVAALAVVFISRLTPNPQNARPMGYTEALIWSTGILCQQGGTWTPPSPAASLLLIVCLFFAVVTYNAYAAFITSVLSVRVASLDTVAAVLHSPDFKIGYIRNGADQMYLMSTKDAQLNAFYIRGYSDAENLVASAEEGLARAARQDYAFFAGQRAARITLRSLSQARGRCAVRELPVPSTRAHLAFPLPRRSPYARPILVGLLQLRSGGALDRLEAALVPAMPQCAPPPGFASARATDVRSALLLLLVGLVTGVVLGIGEYCWKNRHKIWSVFKKCLLRLVSLLGKW